MDEARAQIIAEIEADLAAAAEHKRQNLFGYFSPYDKQREFFDAGIWARERLLMAGNQLGKTYAGAFETTLHLTGRYPDWWLGRRVEGAHKYWAAGESSLVVRDVQQKLLCGQPGVLSAFGTGMIPKADFVDTPSLARGVTDAYDMVQVQHYDARGIKDGVSVLNFKSYEQGRTKFQGDSIKAVWFDEEPAEDIYSEGLTRTVATQGFAYMTFTPLKGMSKVVTRFLSENSPDRHVTTMVIEDAKHISPEERAKIIAGYPVHEREARARGVPMLGSGLIYQVSDSSIMEPAIEFVPDHWVKIWGIDFGIDHPFSAVLILWDRDNDVIHVHHCIKVAERLPPAHAKAIKLVAANAPVAWPHDGNNRDKGSGEPLSKLYRAEGLRMLPSHATWIEGGNSVEAGILEIQERMDSGRFKVASHLSDWFAEKRLYHRKDGVIVRTHNDLMDATRVALMMKREAKTVRLGPGDWYKMRKRHSETNPLAQNVDFDLS
jgi:phage terminase large subunit-like protein